MTSCLQLVYVLVSSCVTNHPSTYLAHDWAGPQFRRDSAGPVWSLLGSFMCAWSAAGGSASGGELAVKWAPWFSSSWYLIHQWAHVGLETAVFWKKKQKHLRPFEPTPQTGALSSHPVLYRPEQVRPALMQDLEEESLPLKGSSCKITLQRAWATRRNEESLLFLQSVPLMPFLASGLCNCHPKSSPKLLSGWAGALYWLHRTAELPCLHEDRAAPAASLVIRGSASEASGNRSRIPLRSASPTLHTGNNPLQRTLHNLGKWLRAEFRKSSLRQCSFPF